MCGDFSQNTKHNLNVNLYNITDFIMYVELAKIVSKTILQRDQMGQH